MSHCGRCHECGTKLRSVLDGETWCDTCKAYRRYRSHGWAYGAAESGHDKCPSVRTVLVFEGEEYELSAQEEKSDEHIS